jgi:hypothetical protein
LTNTYQALVSTVAADTGAALNAVTSPPSSTAMAAVAPTRRRLRVRGWAVGWPDPAMGMLLFVEVGANRGTGNVRMAACTKWPIARPLNEQRLREHRQSED